MSALDDVNQWLSFPEDPAPIGAAAAEEINTAWQTGVEEIGFLFALADVIDPSNLASECASYLTCYLGGDPDSGLELSKSFSGNLQPIRARSEEEVSLSIGAVLGEAGLKFGLKWVESNQTHVVQNSMGFAFHPFVLLFDIVRGKCPPETIHKAFAAMRELGSS